MDPLSLINPQRPQDPKNPRPEALIEIRRVPGGGSDPSWMVPFRRAHLSMANSGVPVHVESTKGGIMRVDVLVRVRSP